MNPPTESACNSASLARRLRAHLTCVLGFAALSLTGTGCCWMFVCSTDWNFGAVAIPPIPEFYDCSIVGSPPPCAACVRHEQNGSFEWHARGRPLGWTGDSTQVVGEDQGIEPCSWNRMLRFEATTPFGPSDQRDAAILQVVDLRDTTLPEPAKVRMSLLVNRVANSLDNRFGLMIQARVGDPLVQPWQFPLSEEISFFTADADPETWQRFWMETDVPEGADFLVVYVIAVENAANDEFSREFEGHYVDGVEVLIGPAIHFDLRLSLRVDPAEANVGDEVAVRLTLVNSGPHVASNVRVSLTLPAELAHTSDSGDGSYEIDQRYWTISEIGANESAERLLTVTVRESGRGHPFVIIAQIADHRGTDLNPANDAASASLQVGPLGEVDMRIQARADRSSVNQGEMVTFTYLLTNLGPEEYGSGLEAVRVGDLLPAGFVYRAGTIGSAQAEPGTLQPGGGHYLRLDGSEWWIGRRMQPGPEFTHTLYLTAQAAAAGTRSSRPHVLYRHANGVVSPFPRAYENMEDNEVLLTVDVLPDELPYELGARIAEFALHDHLLKVRSTLQITNSGPGTASDVVVLDPIPAGLQWLYSYAAHRDQAAFREEAGYWTIPFLFPGDTLLLQHHYGIQSGRFTKEASIIAGTHAGDDALNNSDTATLRVDPARDLYDLRVQQAVDREIAEVGEIVTFTVALTNDGPSMVNRVSVRNTLFNLPQVLPLYNLDRGEMVFSGVAPGQTVTASIRAQAAVPGSYTNTAVINANDAGDTNPANNVAGASVVVFPPSTGENRPPIARSDAFTVTGHYQTVLNVLENDIDPDGHPLTIARIGTPLQGTVVNLLGANISYSAPIGFVGTDAFTYVARDSQGSESNEALVTITVEPFYNLAISAVASNDVFVTNQEEFVFFNVIVSNSAIHDADDVEVEALLPEGFTYRSHEPANADFDAETGRWSIGTVTSGPFVSLRIWARAPANPGTYTFVASITGGLEYDTNAADDETSVIVFVQEAPN